MPAARTPSEQEATPDGSTSPGAPPAHDPTLARMPDSPPDAAIERKSEDDPGEADEPRVATTSEVVELKRGRCLQRAGASPDGDDAEPKGGMRSSGVSASQAHAEPRAAAGAEPGTDPADAAQQHLRRVIESLLFVAEGPVTPRQLARATQASTAEVKQQLQQLVADYTDRGVVLAELAGGYQFRTAAASAPFVRDFVALKPVRLTRAQLETLAIVAYRQPVTRPEIEELRGVDSGSALKVLLERGLLKMLGRKDEPGRPMLYGNSPRFLEFFGLRSLKDLPTLKEFSELTEDSRALYHRKMGEPADPGPQA